MKINYNNEVENKFATEKYLSCKTAIKIDLRNYHLICYISYLTIVKCKSNICSLHVYTVFTMLCDWSCFMLSHIIKRNCLAYN